MIQSRAVSNSLAACSKTYRSVSHFALLPQLKMAGVQDCSSHVCSCLCQVQIRDANRIYPSHCFATSIANKCRHPTSFNSSCYPPNKCTTRTYWSTFWTVYLVENIKILSMPYAYFKYLHRTASFFRSCQSLRFSRFPPPLLWNPKVQPIRPIVFTRARHWSLFCATWIQSIRSHLIPLRFILILSPTYAYFVHVISSLRVSWRIFSTHFPSASCLLHIPPISYSLLWITWYISRWEYK
jgi:hypothetical protein